VSPSTYGPAFLDVCGSAAFLAWIPASCSTIPRPFRLAYRCRVSPGALSTAAITPTLLEVSPSTYDPALLDFRDGAAVLAWIPGSCSTMPGSFSAGLSGTSVPRDSRRRTAPHCQIVVARLRFWLGFPPLSRPSWGPFRPAVRCRVSPG
jgi:hypothetical protein